ncbi:patatin-like phospholipase family protein [Winogradskyella vidalii]|uniref:patatin-like phospholipase family protein n=1 Tax=Winogradskyella vidalii TaxID=2615024 RepID=UPI0015CAB15F|nr:patatin-like phospholipase family protein [Winogradskyella vidalii]
MTVGLVLSGGGMRGAAHIGVIKALEERGIIVTHISGSSAGAIVGALHAYGCDWNDILKIFKSFQIIDISKYALGKPGFIDVEKFYPLLNSYIIDDDFKALKKSLYITATNVLNGELKIFNSGELIKPILASAAFPGVFTPVKIDKSFFIDGGVLNNFPVEPLISQCDVIIGVYVDGVKNIKVQDLKHSYGVVERAFKLKSFREDSQKFRHCDVVISLKELDGFSTFDKKHLDTIFNIGYKATNVELNKNALIKSKFGL